MSFSYKEKKKHLAELCVFGFIKTYCNDNEIPNELQQLCLLMYFQLIDEWNVEISDNRLKFNLNDNILIKPARSSWFNGYGSVIVKKGKSKTWKLRIEDNKPVGIVGISDRQNGGGQGEGIFVCSSNCCGMDLFDGNKISPSYGSGVPGDEYGVKGCYKDDIVTMTLDMTCVQTEYGILSFKVNDIDYGIAFDKIKCDAQYRMAVSMYSTASVQLLE